MVWACDEKRGRRAMENTREKDERKNYNKMVGQSEDDIEDNVLSADKVFDSATVAFARWHHCPRSKVASHGNQNVRT